MKTYVQEKKNQISFDSDLIEFRFRIFGFIYKKNI